MVAVTTSDYLHSIQYCGFLLILRRQYSKYAHVSQLVGAQSQKPLSG